MGSADDKRTGGGGGGKGKSRGGNGNNTGIKYFPGATDFPASDIAGKYSITGGSQGEINVGVVKAQDGGYRAFIMQNGDTVAERGFDSLSQLNSALSQIANATGGKVRKDT